MTIGHARPRGRLARRAALGACLAALAVATPLSLAGCTAATSSSAPTVADTYGGLPTYLPTASSGTDAELTGTVARPALTSEGDTVKVKTADGATARMTVTGPVVPGEGLPYQADYTTCTWTVTVSDASSPIPLRLSDFTTLDQLGRVYTLAAAPGTSGPPASIAPGATVTFKLRAEMKVGEGLMRWAPDGTRIVAKWDFEVEND